MKSKQNRQTRKYRKNKSKKIKQRGGSGMIRKRSEGNIRKIEDLDWSGLKTEFDLLLKSYNKLEYEHEELVSKYDTLLKDHVKLEQFGLSTLQSLDNIGLYYTNDSTSEGSPASSPASSPAIGRRMPIPMPGSPLRPIRTQVTPGTPPHGTVTTARRSGRGI
jgi:hypothetical protein